MIILLDLNYTLVSNSAPRGTEPSPMWKRMETEKYRQWLVEMVKPHHVILITARPERWKNATLERIGEETGWQPQEAWFDDGTTRTPPAIKRHIVTAHIFPRHGREGMLGIESNPKTRAVYAKLGIPSLWVNSTGRSLRDARGLVRDIPKELPKQWLDLE